MVCHKRLLGDLGLEDCWQLVLGLQEIEHRQDIQAQPVGQLGRVVADVLARPRRDGLGGECGAHPPAWPNQPADTTTNAPVHTRINPSAYSACIVIEPLVSSSAWSSSSPPPSGFAGRAGGGGW